MSATPGPWKANIHRDGARIEADGRSVAWVGADTITINETEVMSAQAKADAHLISAAPDLLQACELALRELQRFEDQPGSNTETMGTAALRAAIKKARGQ